MEQLKDCFMSSLCRICAERSSSLVPILSTKSLLEKICKCLPIEISADDDMPANICEACLVKINDSYLFYETCLYADQKLKKLRKVLKEGDVPVLTDSEVRNDSEKGDDLMRENIFESKCDVTNKKNPGSLLWVTDADVLQQAFDEQLKKNQLDDILSGSNIIINISDEAAYCKSDDLNNAKNEGSFTVNYINDGCQEVSSCKADDNFQLSGVQDNAAQLSLELQEAPSTETDVREQQSSSVTLSTEGNHSPEKPYLCDTCGKSFRHANNLKTHVKIHSENRKKFACKVCNKTFFTKFFLQEHMNSHTGVTPYKCQTCGKEFLGKVHLRQHKRTHSSEKFPCPVCGNRFNRKGNMMQHVKKYHSTVEKGKPILDKSEVKKASDVKIACPICKKSFSNQANLQNHQKRHSKKLSHVCSLCGKQFRYSGSLTYHRRAAHTGERPFQCSYCDEKFFVRSVQRIHERKKHTFECPYKCGHCSRRFYNSSSLRNHSYIHAKEKMFQCDVCGKRFSRNSCLFVHKKIHSDDRRYVCQQCGKSYIQRHDIVKHMKVHDPKSKPFFCKYCANSFARKKDFARHAMCQFNYIRKNNAASGSDEKILEAAEGNIQRNMKTLFEEAELLIHEAEELSLEKSPKSENHDESVTVLAESLRAET